MSEKSAWIEYTFHMRECCRFVPSPKDNSRCQCGQSSNSHRSIDTQQTSSKRGDLWMPLTDTQCYPTDAYGTIEFLGGIHSSKAEYLRLAADSRIDSVFQLLTKEWSLNLPKLIITVHGGMANFDVNQQLRNTFTKGLLKTAKTTGAWILTNGLNTGASRHVGDALLTERSPRLRSGRIVSIGVAPWGMVENRHHLVNRSGCVVPYRTVGQPGSRYTVLNSRHSCFLMVDNGTAGRHGVELAFRRKLEKYMASQVLPNRIQCPIPTLCILLEGGVDAIRTVLDYVTDSPPVPVAVFEGSGRAADLLAFAYRHSSEDGDVTETVKEQLVDLIASAFNLHLDKADKLFLELMLCMRKKNLITIFNENGDTLGSDLADNQEVDQVLLSAICRSRTLTLTEQLGLSLAWNKVDIARSHVFRHGRNWTEGILEEAMMDALLNDQVDFVQLLLENGVSMGTFLTIPRLEELYNSQQNPSGILYHLVRSLRPGIPRNYAYNLKDIGIVLNQLMGGAFRSAYTRKKFRVIYRTVMNKNGSGLKQNNLSVRRESATLQSLNNLAIFQRRESYTLPSFNNLAQRRESYTIPTSGFLGMRRDSCLPSIYDNTCGLEVNACIFKHPFNELFIWAVLTQRQSMARLMWQHGKEALIKALVACKLYRAMARQATDNDSQVDIYEEMQKYACEFEVLALELLDFCFNQDEILAQQLMTCALPNWSKQTCVALAFSCHHERLLAHPCAQKILADMWLGGLRTRGYQNAKVMLSLLFPPLIPKLSFKSKEQLQLMPQTEEEHLYYLQDDVFEDEAPPDSSVDITTTEQTLSNTATKRKNSVKFAEPYEDIDTKDGSADNQSRLSTASLDGYKPSKQLRPWKKIYEFYAAPITKFWMHSAGYLAFLLIYSFLVLVKLDDDVQWAEWYVILFIGTLGMETVREILGSEPAKLSQKIRNWSAGFWNKCDVIAVIQFYVGMVIRLQPDLKDHGRVFYCLNIIYWFLRTFHLLSPFRYIGPLVTMMGLMIRKMVYFCMLLFVFLAAYGVFRRSLLYPDEEPSWTLAREVVFKPHFMIYGEEFVEEVDAPCVNRSMLGKSNSTEPEFVCTPGRWLNPIVMAGYLLMTYLLLVNMLIAMFNSMYFYYENKTRELWLFNRFAMVMEYEEKPLLPPPFIFLSHLYRVVKWYWRKRTNGVYDVGLKLYLDDSALERVLDFEEDCMDGLARQKERQSRESVEERMRLLSEKIESLSLRCGSCCKKPARFPSKLSCHETKSDFNEQDSGVAEFRRRLATEQVADGRRPSCAVELESDETEYDGADFPNIRKSSYPGAESSLQVSTRENVVLRKRSRGQSEDLPPQSATDYPERKELMLNAAALQTPFSSATNLNRGGFVNLDDSNEDLGNTPATDETLCNLDVDGTGSPRQLEPENANKSQHTDDHRPDQSKITIQVEV